MLGRDKRPKVSQVPCGLSAFDIRSFFGFTLKISLHSILKNVLTLQIQNTKDVIDLKWQTVCKLGVMNGKS